MKRSETQALLCGSQSDPNLSRFTVLRDAEVPFVSPSIRPTFRSVATNTYVPYSTRGKLAPAYLIHSKRKRSGWALHDDGGELWLRFSAAPRSTAGVTWYGCATPAVGPRGQATGFLQALTEAAWAKTGSTLQAFGSLMTFTSVPGSG